MSRFSYRILKMLLAALLLPWALPAVGAGTLTLAVANSTCGAIKQVGARFREQHDVEIAYICKSSGLLAKGLRGAAIVADVYVSANRPWMDYMIELGLVAPEAVVSPWGNALVVATPRHSKLDLHDWQALASDAVGTILIGDPSSAPFGRYAKQALEKTVLWERVRPKIETRMHISLLAEALAGADDRTVGILYASNLTDDLRSVCAVERSWHAPIRYFVAPVGDAAERAEVKAFTTFLQTPAAREIFLAARFELAPANAP
jgi:molybdate transport system substrate-binding protein